MTEITLKTSKKALPREARTVLNRLAHQRAAELYPRIRADFERYAMEQIDKGRSWSSIVAELGDMGVP
jgi:hypothetical protein